MALLEFIPLVVALGLLVVVGLAQVSPRVERVLTRISLGLYGESVEEERLLSRQAGRETSKNVLLRGAHISATYRVYSANTYLYAGLVGLVGAIVAIYLVFGFLQLLAVPEETLRSALPQQMSFLVAWMQVPELSTTQQFVLYLVASAVIGVGAAAATYQYRWYIPKYRGNNRQRKIDESLQRTVAFFYALSRSGMEMAEIMRILSRNKQVYGEAAREMEVAVRDMDVFGTDIISALQRLGERTPSDEFADFAENFVSVLQGGREVPRFLREQYEYFEEEAEAQQDQFLELLATLAEAYVTAFVAGPLFLITILVVIGFVIGNTLPILRVIVYAVIPLATFGFIVYLDSITPPTSVEPDRDDHGAAWEFLDVRSTTDPDVPEDTDATATDGGIAGPGARSIAGSLYPEETARNVKRLASYNRSKWLRDRIKNPLDYILNEPVAVLYVTIPVAVVYLGARLYLLFVAGDLALGTADDVLVQAVLFVMGTFAAVYEIRQHQIRSVENAIPDFLDRLASVNDAGMPIIESFERIQRSDLGALNEELRRTWTDIEMGAELDEALYRLEERLDTPSVSRAVTLITHSMDASGDLAPVLRIAANEAVSTRRLQQARRQELMTYMVVIYVSFFVFLAIIVALTTVFLPAIPTIENVGGGVGGGAVPGGGFGGLSVGGLSEAQKASYQLVFGHAALVQGLASGLMAGKMSEASIKAGAKHVTVMVGLAYVTIIAFL
jgi:flagellar protein FlaJ